jgi:hypothetical protein
MITYKGRVVYERIQHRMTEKDAARIMHSLNKDKTPKELARSLWGIDMEIVKMQVLDDEAVMDFLIELIVLIVKYVGIGTDWLWKMLMGMLGIHESYYSGYEEPPPPEEEGEENASD